MRYSLTALIAACALLTSCNKEQIVENETSLTHSISFVADQAETKTTMTIGTSTATFEWEDSDENSFTVYEGDAKATDVSGKIGTDGKMAVNATFSGAAPANAVYYAYLNSDIRIQAPDALCYDNNADVLAAKFTPESGASSINGKLLTFERVVAINKMTLKGITPGETVQSVVITSANADLAGVYEKNDWTDKVKTLTINPDGVSATADGAVIYFTCLPAENAMLTVEVATKDNSNQTHLYEKVFQKAITFKKGNVKPFNVAVSEKPNTPTPSESNTATWIASEQDYTNGEQYISATVDENISLTFGDGGNDGKYYTTGSGIRIYSNGKVTVSASNGYSISKIVLTYSDTSYTGTFAANTGSYSLSSTTTGTWTGSASTVVLTNTASSGHARIQKIAVTYVSELPDENSEVYHFTSFNEASDVTLNATNFTITLHKNTGSTPPRWNGASNEARVYAKGSVDVSSTKNIVKIVYDYVINANNSGVAPTVEGAKGKANQGTWNSESKTWTGSDTKVTLSTSGTAGNLGFTSITVYFDDTPAAIKYDVNIIDGIVGGSVSANPTSAAEGTEVLLTATPNDEYEFNNDWAVKDASDNAITVANGKFTMPASAVTVSGSFSKKSYAITATVATNGTYAVKVGGNVVSSASKGDKVALEADPAVGYKLDGFTVTETLSGKEVSVYNNGFTMPGAAVTVSATFSAQQVAPECEGQGTIDDPYTVSDLVKIAESLGNGGVTSEAWYGVGIISSITEVSTEYGNATYIIRDKVDQSKTFTVYRGKYLNNVAFTSPSQISVNDEVVVYGKIKNHNGNTPEFDSGNYIASITKAPYLSATASKTSGIAAAGETITVTVDTNVEGWTVSSNNTEFSIRNKTSTGFDVVVSENTSTTDSRTAKITVSADGVNDVEITLTQNKKSSGGVPVTKSVDLSAQGYANAADVISVEIDNNVTATFDKGENTNAPKYYSSGTAVRCYGGNTITVKAVGKIITAIKLTYGSSDGSNAISTDVGTFTSPNWSGESDQVVFTIGGTTGNRRIKGIEVTYK